MAGTIDLRRPGAIARNPTSLVRRTRPFHFAGYTAGQPEELARIPKSGLGIDLEKFLNSLTWSEGKPKDEPRKTKSPASSTSALKVSNSHQWAAGFTMPQK